MMTAANENTILNRYNICQ